MARTARATLLFPRTGQRIRVEVPVEQYEAVVRRNQEIIRSFSPKDTTAAGRDPDREKRGAAFAGRGG